jgi:hypothetical protein
VDGQILGNGFETMRSITAAGICQTASFKWRVCLAPVLVPALATTVGSHPCRPQHPLTATEAQVMATIAAGSRLEDSGTPCSRHDILAPPLPSKAYHRLIQWTGRLPFRQYRQPLYLASRYQVATHPRRLPHRFLFPPQLRALGTVLG